MVSFLGTLIFHVYNICGARSRLPSRKPLHVNFEREIDTWGVIIYWRTLTTDLRSKNAIRYIAPDISLGILNRRKERAERVNKRKEKNKDASLVYKGSIDLVNARRHAYEAPNITDIA